MISLAVCCAALISAIVQHGSRPWIVLVALATLLMLRNLVLTRRAYVSVGEGWIEAADLRGAVRFEAGHAVWQARAERRGRPPRLITLIDEHGRRTSIGIGLYPREAGDAIFAAVQALFPAVSRQVRRALPEHQHTPRPEGLDQPW